MLLDLDAPFHLALSACVPNDPEENEKIKTIGREIDRFFSLLQLQSAYDSNEFTDVLYDISEAIRGKSVGAFRQAFDAQLKAMIAARRNVPDAEPPDSKKVCRQRTEQKPAGSSKPRMMPSISR